MGRPSRRTLLLAVAGVVVALALLYAFVPDPIPVDTAVAARGPLQVVVEEEGETHIEDRYVITAPVAAYLGRIRLEAGDTVGRGEVVARLERPRSAILDPRTRAQAQARLRAAEAALADAAVAVERTAADRERARALLRAGAVSPQRMEEADAAARRAVAEREAARAERAAALAELRGGREGAGEVPEVLRAPAAGRILSVRRRSEGHVAPGEPLIEVGDTRRLEIRADVLSQDAVRIRPGTRVIVDQWGGDTTLDAVVTRVEPEAVTEVSALGVEEQRVPVRADLTSPPEAWAGLGSGYRVLARFVVWEEEDVLQVPTSALFRTDQGWGVFAVEGGRAVRRAVELGRQAGLASQVLSGIANGDTVVVHPPNELEDGARVGPRAERI